MTTIAATISAYQRVVTCASLWLRARREFAHAVTSTAHSGAEQAAARRSYEDAQALLAVAVDELNDDDLPAAANGMSGAPTRRVIRLEGEIVLAALAYFHSREEARLASPPAEVLVDEHEQLLRDKVRDLIGAFAEVAAT